MPLYLSNLKYELDQPVEQVFAQARKRLGPYRAEIVSLELYKRSLDARQHRKPQFVVTVRANLRGDEEQIARRLANPQIQYREVFRYEPQIGSRPLDGRIVVVGFGPAGIFCAYELAKRGYHPLVLERGKAMEERVADVEGFWKGGELQPQSNVQFGEGGAGTFSDGKLTTRINDPRCEEVLSVFAAFGAPKDILTKAKPHIGTDRLRGVIRAIRQEILRLGGEIRFGQKLEALHLQNNRLCGITVNGESISCTRLALAIGHSARDTFRMLYDAGIPMEAKSFSVGARIEHRQETIDRGLYGAYAGHPALPPGEYQLSHRENGRGVYTFCMCPGGVVVPAASEPDTVVTNGMSCYARDGANANAALVVGVSPEDFGHHPLDGVRFQELLERRAFTMGGRDYRAPAADVQSFLQGKPGLRITDVFPTYARGVERADFDALFPAFVTERMRTGLWRFGNKLPGFDRSGALLTGPETRTSSPVRILRGENGQSPAAAGLYPCGEGAGFAGGIMSAAVDGLRIAEAILREFAPPEKPL